MRISTINWIAAAARLAALVMFLIALAYAFNLTVDSTNSALDASSEIFFYLAGGNVKSYIIEDSVVSAPSIAWLFGSTLGLLAAVRRRKS